MLNVAVHTPPGTAVQLTVASDEHNLILLEPDSVRSTFIRTEPGIGYRLLEDPS